MKNKKYKPGKGIKASNWLQESKLDCKRQKKLLVTYQTAETTQQENHKNVIPSGVASSVSGI